MLPEEVSRSRHLRSRQPWVWVMEIYLCYLKNSFDCEPVESRDPKKCYFQGKVLDVGDAVDDSLLGGSCSGACHCVDKKFNCAQINCPENFGPRPELGCVRQYSNDKCCSTGTVCGEFLIQPIGIVIELLFSWNLLADEAKKLVSCDFEGKTYKEGERMQPQDHKCHKCICTKDFDGSKPVDENKDCVKISCNIELLEAESVRDGCIPSYHKDSCCPYSWRCPSKYDAIIPGNHDEPKDPKSPKCKFGNLSLEIGDSLSADDSSCSKCACNNPPMADCTFTSCWIKSEKNWICLKGDDASFSLRKQNLNANHSDVWLRSD